MIKSVKNVTSRTLKISAWIRQTKTSTDILLIQDGIYELNPAWDYPSMISEIERGNLVIIEGTLDTAVADSTVVPKETTFVEDTDAVEEDVEQVTPETDSADSEDVSGVVEEETEPLTFTCEICGEVFGSKRGLQSHVARSHKDSV